MRIDSSGRLLVGTESAIANTGGVNAQSQVHSATAGLTQALVSWSSSGSDPARLVLESTGGAVGTRKAVEDQNTTGLIRVQADNGTEFLDQSWIRTRVGGTPTATSIPGRLEFHTTQLGDGGPSERPRIDSDGDVFIGGVIPSAPNITSRNLDWRPSKARLVSGHIPVASLQLKLKVNLMEYTSLTLVVTTPQNLSVLGQTDQMALLCCGTVLTN